MDHAIYWRERDLQNGEHLLWRVLSVWHGKWFQYVSMAIYNMYLVIQKQ